MLYRNAIPGLVVAACILAGTEQVGAGTIVSPQTIVFSDQNYLNSSWIIPDMTDVIFAGQVLTGGIPGSYREIVMTGANDGVFAANLNTNFKYDPSIGGVIDSVTYNVDLKTFNNNGAEYYALLEQAGVLYINLNGLHGIFNSRNGWTNSGDVFLYPQSFVVLDSHPGHGYTQGQSGRPDFSTTGSEITFGYAVNVPSSGSITSVTGIDNDPITLTVTPTVSSVPEPSCLVLLGTGIGLLLVIRRKRQ